MAEESKTGALPSYSGGVNWLVGLSAAVVAGAFLHYADVQCLGLGVRMAYFTVALMFAAATWAGVNYAFWLFHADELRAAKERLDDKLNNGITQAEWDKKNGEIEGLKKKARRWITFHHVCLIWGFSIGVIGAATLLGTALWTGQKLECDKDKNAKNCTVCPPAPSNANFVVTHSAVHRTNVGMQAHTFLLNQENGSLWMMVCDKDGKNVSFQWVKRTDLHGIEMKMVETTPPKEIVNELQQAKEAVH
jgi:hypothetical protein